MSDWLSIFILVILPNIFYVNDRETTTLRGVIYIVLAIVMLYIWRKNTLIACKEYWIPITILIVTVLTSAIMSKYPYTALFGYKYLPAGSITILSSFFVGFLITKNSNKQYNHIVFSAIVSSLIALLIYLTIGLNTSSRVVGFQENSLAFAILLGVASIISWHRFLNNNKFFPYGYLVLGFIVFIGFSSSRLALMTLLFSLAISVVILKKEKIKMHHVRLIAIFITILILTLLLLIPRLTNIKYAFESIEFRQLLINRGIELIKEKPLGIGYGTIGLYTFSESLPSALLEPYHRKIFIESTHNFWVDTTIALGLVGGAISMYYTIKLSTIALKNLKDNLDISGILFFYLLMNFLLTPASLTLLVLAGVISKSVLIDSKQE